MERTSNKSAAAAVAIIVLLPIAYVLSTGPAVWLAAHKWIPDEPLIIYAPIGWAMDKSPVVTSGMNVYLSLWSDEFR